MIVDLQCRFAAPREIDLQLQILTSACLEFIYNEFSLTLRSAIVL